MQRILDAVLAADCAARVILSNNNPDIDILDHVDPPPPPLDIRQQVVCREPVMRHLIARDCDPEYGDYFVSIDDDMFLTPDQIDALVRHLHAEPAVPHGVWGERAPALRGPRGRPALRLESGLHGFTGPVDVINCVYAFTRAHVRRYFELVAALGIDDPNDLGRGDDIVLSYCGTGRPVCHDPGPLEICPSSDAEGIALWRSKDFFKQRHWKLLRLSRMVLNRLIRLD